MATLEDEIWQWAGPGTPDKRSDRGRTYYNQVSVHRRHINKKRYFKVGDAVVMSGDGGQVWIAQIVNLFQTQHNDIHIKELLRNSTARNDDERRHELMRCTLRWFYNINDMNHHTLSSTRLPKPIPNEIWFSDHVEQDGYNDVQVIEGKAWLFPSAQAQHAFVKDPDPTFDRRKDELRVVRCFVDSNTDHLPVRELERTELDRLLRNPTTDKDLFENSRLRLYGSAGAVLKGTGKKKRRHTTLRSPINVREDEFEPSRRDKRSRVQAVEAKVELGLKGAPEAHTGRSKTSSIRRRRKIDDNDDEDDRTHANSSMRQRIDSDDDDDDEPLTNRIQELDRQQQADARRIERENKEVFALVSELNDNALNEELDENSKSSGKPAQSAKPGQSARPTQSTRPAHSAKPTQSANFHHSTKHRRHSEAKELSATGKGGFTRRHSDVSGRPPSEHKSRRREPETIVIYDDADAEKKASSQIAQKGKALPPMPVTGRGGSNRQTKVGKSTFTGGPFMPTQRTREAALGKSRTSISDKAEKATPRRKSMDGFSKRQNSEKGSSSLQKVTEKSQVGKDTSQLRYQGHESGNFARPQDKQFFVEITAAMNRMKIDLAKMPSESKSVVKGKMDWIVGSVIDKMFDGRKERTHNSETSEARKIVDLTLKEFQQAYLHR